MEYKFQVEDKVNIIKEKIDFDGLATEIKEHIDDIHIVHDTWLDTREDVIKYKLLIGGEEYWFSEYELEEYKGKYKSIFDNLTDLEFEEMLKECGFKYSKVDGKGGLFIKDDYDEDCICRKGEQDVGIHESIYYCQDRKAWVLSLETDRYYVVSSEETEIQYCPHCGRKLE